MPHWKVNIRSLHLAVETVQRYRRITARDVATEVGIPASTLTRLKDGHKVDIDAFVSIVAWLRADPQRFIERADGAPVEGDEGRVLVSREDLLLAWSWAREALGGLPDRLMPSEEARPAVTAALQRLHEEIGLMPNREPLRVKLPDEQEPAYGAHPAPQSAEG